MRTSETAKLMAAMQTRLLEAGMYAIDAQTFVEHAVAWANVHRSDTPINTILERSFEYKLGDWALGAFLYAETPEGTAYWWDVVEGL